MGAVQTAEKKYAIDFTPEEKKVIRAQFFPPSATDTDMQFCMTVAREMGLNPLLHEIYFVERRAKVNNQWVTKIEPMPGRNAWIKLAHASGKFAGMESDAKIERFPRFVDGKWVEEDDLVATAKVWRTDMKDPIVVKVNFSEYAQKTKDGNLTQFWREKPTTMLKKVAEVQALKKAFAVSGLYDPAEVEPFENEEPLQPETVKAFKQKPAPRRSRLKKSEVEAIAKAEEVEAVEASVIEEK